MFRHLAQKNPNPTEQVMNITTAGITTTLHTRSLRCSQEQASAYTAYRGISPFPASLFHPFHLRSLSTGAFVQVEVQIQKPTNKRKSPSFPLHHSHIGPTPSQTHRDYFLIRKNPEPFSYRHTSISRYCFMYTIVQSRENSVSPGTLQSLFDSSKSSVSTGIAPFLPQEITIIDQSTLHQKRTLSICIYLPGIDTDPITYPTDTRWRWRLIPVLSHVPCG